MKDWCNNEYATSSNTCNVYKNQKVSTPSVEMEAKNMIRDNIQELNTKDPPGSSIDGMQILQGYINLYEKVHTIVLL